MATLTYDPTPADQPEFNESEQEALAIGEQAVADQQRMYADKFKDAEALEQAYIELQKKLGEPNAEQEVRDEESSDAEEEVNEEEENPIYDLLNEASNQFYNNDGQISEEVLEELAKLDSDDLISAYITMQGERSESVDFTDADVNNIYNVAGGEDAYNNLTEWAQENVNEEYVDAFNSLVEEGNLPMVQLAVAGLQAEFERNNGYEGEMLTGRAAQSQPDVFRSQAEVVAAMQDPRYDSDPAYRQDVFAKLENSDLGY